MRPFAPRQLLVLSAILVVVSIPIAAQAQRGPAQEALAERAEQMRNKPPFPPGLAEGRLIRQMDEDGEQLDLDEKTLAKLDAAIDELRAAEDAHREKSQAALKKMNGLLNEDTPDEKALMEVSALIGDLANEMRNRRLVSTLGFRSLLTPDQLKEFMKLRKQLPIPREKGKRPKQ
jgi:Spy/CpxP family protein refolding chaperone